MLAAGVRTVTLDLATQASDSLRRGMHVSAVMRGGTALAFTHTADHLAVTLDHPSAAGEEVELVVQYAGVPAGGLEIRPNKYGDRAFFSDNWPNKAHQWLPTIDHISDKATMEMDVVAPAHYQVVSNGRLMETTDLPGERRRTVWRESVPIAPWLYVLAAARFAVQHVGDYHGTPIETWVFTQDRDAGFSDFAVPTRDVIAFFSENVGPFSYEKLANVQSDASGGGMEAASAIMYNSTSVTGTRSVRWRNVVIHELAHQWFGDAVTERDWDDVWLSEGFATYFTLLFIEHAYGHDEFVAGLRTARQTVIDYDAKTPGVRVVHDNLADMAKVTSPITYQKGAWTLHMLRERIGDDRFWAGIRDYYAQYRNGSASTTDFRRAMERASGQDLAGFFQQWLYRAGVPRISGTWHWDAAARRVMVDLTQTQPGDVYELPVEIGITQANGAIRVERADLTGRSEHFSFAAADEPVSVVLDPNVRLLMAATMERR
ncbi:MAG TPA: M1 family aminopeptidase, partial [Gemmatimonadaceae bacterium]|nr:M1 family aminopeptidase [Gemmatimonadaceae bacterium]